MRPYFEEMTPLGKPLTDSQKKNAKEDMAQIEEVEKEVAAAVEAVKNAGIPAEIIKKRGQLTVWERIDYLIDPGTWCPLHTLYNPQSNEEGTTGVIDGLAKINGKWAVVIGFDNKVMAGAWIAGQADNQLRVTDMAKRLHVPLVWIVNCSGVKLTEQQEVYANRRGNGTTFFRHAELEKLGVPIIAGIYGTNPAGGGYQGISPTILLAHKDANIAVGGGGIVGGMSPKGSFDEEGAEQLIDATRHFKQVPPGSVPIHHNETGFFKEVYDNEEGVLDALKKYMDMVPAYDPHFFRVAEPKEPKFPADDINSIVAFNQKRSYNFDEMLARIFDNSEHMEFRPDYGPEVYTGLAKINGFLMGFIGNRQGFLGANYPEYADYPGIGGKLYRQGLIKLNEFVTLCGRDRVPIVWFQDTSGIDVGDIAEKAELLGLGQSLIYSIEQTDVPQMCIILRKGTAAAHYIMGGPTANNHNAFTLGTPTTEIYVMHGETAAAASFSRRLVKEKDAGKPLQPVIDKMNALAQQYYDNSRPIYCANRGFVDEIVSLPDLRKYIVAFAGCSYQNPISICPQNHMMIPRIIKG
ncbi:MAG: glutaconyl-CoA decarboxylase subunit alpha [Deltaproteobacteria bacterium]|nr:glutaconyl-CoA decarboxylase subunit alpha [Deltaproteobacteria bacterium]MBW1738427.1 glutaconyl-CoA decarboxylase subunit alpha [Deltaproteobacteria bacterium]MBW1910016.1 glutaconyl-CoA decarboxylase subunit alpha [Deltaproteobacteria bacterium]MBW2033590.1 glutaconyl-CoA decarboxylase subunit alpha [Deltaproteobacteria bacterium]MBW2115146.1 glutaconyl-CoA decarboxylase subunit alpha [Deltaproteobacteria bacterium]